MNAGGAALAGQQEKPLMFLVVGAGAVGGFVGARLADAGYDATVLVPPLRAARLRDEGLRIASRDRTSVLRPTVGTAAELTPGYDAIVLAVKSDDHRGNAVYVVLCRQGEGFGGDRRPSQRS